jgi:signal transduction histidine kinase
VGIVAQRAALRQQTASEADARGRCAAAEELITILAHDFRNFMTPLRGRLELLGRRARRDGHAHYVRDADELVGTLDRLDRLVRDLLDTARLEQGLFNLMQRPVDLVELVAATVGDFAPGENSVHVRTKADEIVVSADPSRIRQAVENLLSNALKVQPENAPVVVELEVCEAWAVVAIEDRGPGIAPEILPTLFQRFASGSGSVGLGLGLYLARGIAEAHGGSVEVDSRVGRGARFTLRLPLERAALGVNDSHVGPASGRHAPYQDVVHSGVDTNQPQTTV